MKQGTFPGDELRRYRKERGLSLADVFRKTRIPMRHLDAMERGDARALPPLCYASGFVRTYCQFLGIPPERYCDCLRGCDLPVSRFRHRRATAPEGPSWKDELLTWASICAVLIVVWLTYAYVVRPDAGVSDKNVEAGTVEMVVPPAPANLEF